MPDELDTSGIGALNESTLHADIKRWLAKPGDKFEVKVEGSIIDIVRENLLIEIQTSNFAAIRKKLSRLIQNNHIRLVYPIAVQKWIVRLSANGKRALSRRRSPKKGKLIEVFDEMLRMPELINHPHFTLEVLMIKTEEFRCDDGKGSWRRKGISIKDRRLLEVVKTVRFADKRDFLDFLPGDIPQPFSTRSLAAAMKVTVYQARRIIYALRRMEAIAVTGKKGNLLLYHVIE